MYFLSTKALQRRFLLTTFALVILAVGLTVKVLSHPQKAYAASDATCVQFGTINIAGKSFVVQNDQWNSAATGQQCISADTNSGNFTVTTANNSLPTNGPPASYASIFKGCHWGNCTDNSGMPIQASAVGSANSTWNINTVGGSWDSAYDIWFNQTPTTSGQPNGAELMVWINHSGPPQPIGSQVATVNINGASWAVWVGNIGWNVISYVRTSGTTSVNFDLNNFFHDAEGRGQVANNWYLIAVEAGFELWSGGAGMGSSGFNVSINGGGGNTTGSLSTASVVSLRAHANSNYVTADNAGASPLIANRTAVGPWETFDLISNTDGSVSLRAHANGDYVTADNAGTSPLIANRTTIGAWEEFDLINNADGSVSLRAHANGNYVTADNAGASPLIANRTTIGAWEEFDLIRDTVAISLRAHANSDYVTADNAGASPLIANRTTISAWETFDLISNADGSVSLRAHANNDIVTADNAGASPLIANRTAIGAWEEFDLVENADGSVSLRAHANNDIVTADNAGASPLIANRTAIGPWEEFDLLYD